jgi:DNA-binding transcriptional ArsR family regulator
MNTLEIFKTLANETRLNILTWLKEPAKYFPRQEYEENGKESWSLGVCVGNIQEKAGISQSTISHYLDMMQRCGLLSICRRGKKTYYRRNEEMIQELAQYIKKEGAVASDLFLIPEITC